jgi:anti-sigma regulatory factor (Ser/Thr protein kinase)
MTSGDEDRSGDTFAYHLARASWPPANAYAARLELEATRAAGAATRRALEAHLLERVTVDELELLKTLACELVANAVVHRRPAAGRVELLIGASPRCLRIEVRDDGPGFEPPRSPSPHREGGGGYGLVIVDRAASRWGVASDEVSCVWFELDR